MLKINDVEFKIKSTEMNIKERTYEGNSIVTVEVMTEFFPKMVDGDVLSGAVEVKLDMSDIKAIGDLEHKEYHGNIGIVTLSIQKNGVWEHASVSEFDFKFGDRKQDEFEIELETKNPNSILRCNTTLVSLYTTNVEKLKDHFNLDDFYNTPVVREIGKSTITKYYVKTV